MRQYWLFAASFLQVPQAQAQPVTKGAVVAIRCPLCLTEAGTGQYAGRTLVANTSAEWMYLKRGLPMEIIQEYDNWRKVRDAEGNEGWIMHSLLSGSRTQSLLPGKGRRHDRHAERGQSRSCNCRPGRAGSGGHCFTMQQWLV
ncbi:MAG: SH3 domain-containing protein [Nitratireductor sp.]